MTVYHYAPFPVMPALALAAALALALLGHITSKAVRKMSGTRAVVQSRKAARLGYRQRQRF